MNNLPRISYWWPLVFGIAIGVGATLSVLVLFGPAKLDGDRAGQLTDRALLTFHPEREVPLYTAGCALTALLIMGFSQLWQRRYLRIALEARGEFVRRGAAQLSVGVVMFLLQLSLLLMVQRWGVSETHAISPFLMCSLAAPMVFLLSVATLGGGWPLGVAPPPLVRLLASPPAAEPQRSLRMFLPERGLDLLVPLLLGAIIYIPAWREFAGQAFVRDELFHWDHFAMGPTLAFHHGKALVTETYSLYGLGWPVLFNALSSVVPLTYGRLIQAATLYNCLYFVGVYIFLRLVAGRPVWAAAGVLFALSLQAFHGLSATEFMGDRPNNSVLRSAMDVWFFIALFLHLRSGRVVWAGIAGMFVGLALLFSTDTGLFLAIACISGWFFARGVPMRRSGRRAVPLQWPVVLCLSTTTVVLLMGLAVASRGTLWRREFWPQWLEPLVQFGGGITMLPIFSVPLWGLLLFSAMLVVHLTAAGHVLLRRVRGESTTADALLGVLAGYGLLTLIRFVGHSHPHYLFHLSVPFSVVVTMLLARLDQYFLGLAGARRLNDGPRAGRFFQTMFPWGVLGSVVVWFFANPAVRTHPGILRSLLSDSRSPGGICLLHAPEDVCGLPDEAKEFGRRFDATVSAIRGQLAAGRTVAILDDTDTIFYVASGATPWWRYSPCFSAIMRRSELDALQHAIATEGPQQIFIRPNGNHARRFAEEDVWRAVHDTVQKKYQSEGTAGFFESWKRNQD